MQLHNDFIRVNVNEIVDASSYVADATYDLEGYSAQEYKSMLLIEAEGSFGQRSILLYCHPLGKYEYCTVLHGNCLAIVKFNTLYRIDFSTGEILTRTFPEMAGAFALFTLEGGYLIHGECEIVKLDAECNTEWEYFGADIFASPNGGDCLRILEDRIELLDFSGNRYTIPLTSEFKEQAREKDDRQCSFKENTENPIILDFSTCNRMYDLHDMLKEKFGLPDYYGKNWAALWDCLRGLFDEEVSVEIYNFYALSPEEQERYKLLFEVFDDVHEETPCFTYKIIS